MLVADEATRKAEPEDAAAADSTFAPRAAPALPALVALRSWWSVGASLAFNERLAAHPLLAGLRHWEVRRWARAADEVEFEAGQVLLNEDRIGYWFFLIHSGTVVRQRNGVPLGSLGPGDHLGEEATLAFRPQPATVTAETTVRAFVVGRRHLLPLVEDEPVVRHRLFPGVEDAKFVAKLRELRAAADVEWRAIGQARLAALVAADGGPRIAEQRPGRSVRGGGPSLAALSTAMFVRQLPAGAATSPAERTKLSARTRLIVTAVVAALACAAAALYHPPMIVVTPMSPIDVAGDISVEGVPVHAVRGRYLLVPVHFDRPNGFGALAAIVRRQQRLPVGSPQTRQEVRSAAKDAESLFRRSQQDAAAAAASAAGMDVGLHGDGAEVVEILDARTRQALRVGDVILAIDGAAVRVASDADHLLAPRPPESRVRVTVERHGRKIDVSLVTPRAGAVGSPGLPAALVTRNPNYKLPFVVKFRQRSIGGPSGGLVYALALTDLLGGDDLARGRTVAATGTIDPAGEVGPIGYLRAKLQAAGDARVTVFLVPTGQVAHARGHRLPVHGVLTLRDALRYLSR